MSKGKAGSTARVPVKFSVRCFEAVNDKLPDGRVIEIPRHWRMYDEQEHVIASGPYQSEPIILALVKLSAAYTAVEPTKARALMVDLQHTTRKVALLDSKGQPMQAASPDVGSDAWWDAHTARLPKGVPIQ